MYTPLPYTPTNQHAGHIFHMGGKFSLEVDTRYSDAREQSAGN